MVSCCSCHSPVLFGAWRNVNDKGAHRIKRINIRQCSSGSGPVVWNSSSGRWAVWWSSLQGLEMLFGLQLLYPFPDGVVLLLCDVYIAEALVLHLLLSCCHWGSKMHGIIQAPALPVMGFSSCFLYSGSKEMFFSWKDESWVISLYWDHIFRITEVVFISVLGTCRL